MRYRRGKPEKSLLTDHCTLQESGVSFGHMEKSDGGGDAASSVTVHWTDIAVCVGVSLAVVAALLYVRPLQRLWNNSTPHTST